MSKKTYSKLPLLSKENAILLREASKIVTAIGKMFYPCCEVVLHDLTQPKQSIIAIECPLSGRKIGEATTELGLARINDPKFPEIVQNYPNAFADGRPVKSTSIGLKNSEGKFIAAICLNLDVSLFSSMQSILKQLISTELPVVAVKESLRAKTISDLREAIENFATQKNTNPRNLSLKQRRELIGILDYSGFLHLRNAISTIAETIGVSRGSIYNILKK